jgi:hypothetical protein
MPERVRSGQLLRESRGILQIGTRNISKLSAEREWRKIGSNGLVKPSVEAPLVPEEVGTTAPLGRLLVISGQMLQRLKNQMLKKWRNCLKTT